MTRIAFVAAAALALTIACKGPGDGDGTTPTASPSPSASPSAIARDAREILRMSDDAMNRLKSVKEVSSGNQTVTVLREAPDRSQADFSAERWSRCVAGSRLWERQLADDGAWGPWTLSEETSAERKWPDFRRAMERAWSDDELRRGASEVEEFSLVGETEFAGKEVWIITYDYSAPTTEGPIPVMETEWIAKESLWLLKAERWQDDPFGFTGTTTTVFSLNNEPQGIECPVPGDAGVGG